MPDNYNEKVLPAGATMAAYLRCKIDSSGTLQLAGATDPAIGPLSSRGAVTGTPASVAVAANCAVVTYVANEAIPVGAVVYAGAVGKVTDTAGTLVLGQAITAAAADGAAVQVIRTVP